MSDASIPTSPGLPNRKRSSRARAGVRARERRLQDERREALKDPDRADLPPAAVSIRDFRIMTGLSAATIFRLLLKGKLKSTKLGGRRLIAFSEVERLLRGE